MILYIICTLFRRGGNVKVDPTLLREVLQEKITIINNELPKRIRKDIEDWMVSHYNVEYGDASGVFKGLLPIQSLSYEMLYKLTSSMYKILKNDVKGKEIYLGDLNVEKYFTEVELSQFEMPFPNEITDEDIVINDWLQINYDQFTIKASINQVIKWRDINKLKYNPDTQRDLIYKDSKGGVLIKTVDINEKSIDEMMELISTNDFFADELTININTDINVNSDQLIQIKDKKLIIPHNAQIDLIDGFHRYVALCKYKDLNPDFEFTIKFNLVMWDTEKANKFILQQDKKNHLSDKQVARTEKNEVNYVIDRLASSSRFHLRNTLDKDMKYELNIIIKELFNPTKREDAIPLFKLIEKTINELVEEMEMYNAQFTKVDWFIYLYLIKLSQDEKIDFLDMALGLDIDSLKKEIYYRNKPLRKHYRLIAERVKECV